MRLILMCCALLPMLAANAGEVYRWVDENGVVHYSDRPVTDQAERVAVRAPRPTQTPPAPPPADVPAGSDAQGKLFAEPDPEQVDAQRSANCEAARARLAQLERAPRLYREGADGERQFLADDEIEVLREEARELVDAWCD